MLGDVKQLQIPRLVCSLFFIAACGRPAFVFNENSSANTSPPEQDSNFERDPNQAPSSTLPGKSDDEIANDEIIKKFEELPLDQQKSCLDARISMGECIKLAGFSVAAEQPELGGKIDILWIVDNSGSMAEEQRALGVNFSSFISQLVDSGIDFQTAVTSTDTCETEAPDDLSQVMCPNDEPSLHHRGKFMGIAGSTVLTSSTPNLDALFRDYTNIGTDGSSFEHGLSAAKMGLEKSLSGENDPLIREDAFLSVIVVSDEEDDGIGLSQPDEFTGINYFEQGLTTYKYTDDDFIGLLDTIKPNKNYSVSAITGMIDERTKRICQSASASPNEIGTQYIKAAQKTGGGLQSICDEDWDRVLSEMGTDIGSQLSRITLSPRPVPKTIKVFVDEIPSTDWTYAPASQTIRFVRGHLPAHGAKIRVQFLSKI